MKGRTINIDSFCETICPFYQYQFKFFLKMSDKIATTVYLTEKQKTQLEELNDRLKIPMSELIRQGVDLILRKYDENLSGQISFFEGFRDTEKEAGVKTKRNKK